MYYIGIDLGTSGTKTVLFDGMGNMLASHTVKYLLYQPRNGWAEQDPMTGGGYRRRAVPFCRQEIIASRQKSSHRTA